MAKNGKCSQRKAAKEIGDGWMNCPDKGGKKVRIERGRCTCNFCSAKR